MSGDRTRWRLILGQASSDELGGCTGADGDVDQALAWLYDREVDNDEAGARGGSGPEHTLTVPDWINAVHRLFPKEAIERLEADAFHRYHLHEVVTRLDALQAVAPSLELCEAILRCRNQMEPRVLDAARKIVADVVEEMRRKLTEAIEHRWGGTPWRARPSRFRSARNFDAPRTIRTNLKHWNLDRKRLIIEGPRFFSRLRRQGSRWHVIVLVDQSGSMLGNTIHAAVLGACLWSMPAVRTHLCVFDTEVVDLTEHVEDPVEILFRVQLGGGTTAAKALRYAESLVEVPHRTVVLIVTDFEDSDPDAVVRGVQALVEAGCLVFGAASLDARVAGSWDRETARRCVEAGASVAATTPSELVGWLLERMRQ